MAINNNTGYISLLLTIEGAARANQLKDDGIELKVTHMRVYRTPTPVQNIPYTFTGTENRAQVDSWQALPNAATTYPIIENVTIVSEGYLNLLGTLGAEIGTFNYDAIGLFLEDDTLYAIAVTNRIFTKRKATLGSSANIQQLSFSIAHSTIQEQVNFNIQETVIDYTKITEVQNVSDLPPSVPKEVIYRVTNNAHQRYAIGAGFRTFLASQKRKYVGTDYDDMWVMHDHQQLFERLDVIFTIQSGVVNLSIPKTEGYQIDLIPVDREVILSFFNPNKAVAVPPAIKVKLTSKSTDSTNYNFTYTPIGTSLASIPNNTQLRGILYIHGSDSIYQDAVKNAVRLMTELEYSLGRTFQTDDVTVNPAQLLQNYWHRNSTWTKLDSNIAVATSSFDGRLFNPAQLQPIVFKPEDIKHMTLRATNVWINRTTNGQQPTLVLDKGVATFGSRVRATITVAGAKQGTQIAWYTRSPDKAGLISSPPNTVGYVILDANGVGYVDIDMNWGIVDAQYRIYIGLAGYPIERQCLLMPIEGEIYFAADPQGLNKLTDLNEGLTGYVIVRTVYPYNGLELYLSQEAGTTVLSSDFEDPIPLSVMLTQGFNATPIRVKDDHLTEGNEQLVLGLYGDIDRTAQIGTNATLGINDTSINVTPQYEMFFSASQFSDTPLTLDSILGDTVWLIIKATNVPIVHDVTIDFSGDFNLVDDAEPNVMNPLTLTLTNGRGAYRIGSVAPTTTPPVGVLKRELNITANRLTTFNIYSEYMAAYGAPPNDLELTVNVYPNVYVVGTTTSNPAIDGRGSWGGGVILKVENKGKIYGRGGDGANLYPTDYRPTARAATNGGVAIIGQNENPLYVNNYTSLGAEIKGGGGGGGAMTMTLSNAWVPDTVTNEMRRYSYVEVVVSGGGGQPLGKGGGYSYPMGGGYCGGDEFCSETSYNMFNMQDATLTAPSGLDQNFFYGWVGNGEGNAETLNWSTQPISVPNISQAGGFVRPYGGVVGANGDLQFQMQYYNFNPESSNAVAGATSQGLVYISNL